MKKSIKCGIAAAMLVAAGFTAYQSYSSYGVQDNSLLMHNVEALASGADAEGDSDSGSIFDSNIKMFSSLNSGKCGYLCETYEVTYSVNGASSKVTLGLIGGKFVNNVGAEVNYPNITYKKKVDDQFRVETGDWKVCVRSWADILETCDRCNQHLCDGKRIYCNEDLAIPKDALDV